MRVFRAVNQGIGFPDLHGFFSRRKVRELFGIRLEVEIHLFGLTVLRFFRKRNKAVFSVKFCRVLVGIRRNEPAPGFIPADEQDFNVVKQLRSESTALQAFVYRQTTQFD